MTVLIERLQEANEGSRELDAEIAKAVYPRLELRGNGQWYIDNIHVRIEPYTTSIDAALTLMPEGWEYEITTLYGVAHVELPLNTNDIPSVGRREDGNVPLALCGAIMKVREDQP